MDSPAEKLLEMTLGGGWKVTELIPKVPGHTGGHFSVGYIVESDKGEKAFLKALDFLKVISPGSPDPVRPLGIRKRLLNDRVHADRKSRNPNERAVNDRPCLESSDFSHFHYTIARAKNRLPIQVRNKA